MRLLFIQRGEKMKRNKDGLSGLPGIENIMNSLDKNDKDSKNTELPSLGKIVSCPILIGNEGGDGRIDVLPNGKVVCKYLDICWSDAYCDITKRECPYYSYKED